MATKATVTMKHLAARLAKDHHLTKRMGQMLIHDLIDQITRHLKHGERVRTQSRNRRADRDQGWQESRIPAQQGIEARRVTGVGRRVDPSSTGAAASAELHCVCLWARTPCQCSFT